MYKITQKYLYIFIIIVKIKINFVTLYKKTLHVALFLLSRDLRLEIADLFIDKFQVNSMKPFKFNLHSISYRLHNLHFNKYK